MDSSADWCANSSHRATARLPADKNTNVSNAGHLNTQKQTTLDAWVLDTWLSPDKRSFSTLDIHMLIHSACEG